ncbi:MAG TPA: hypothetical protein VKE70_25080 [Candidatus Solibacter sp.]|nr:hypothetical protein [Candidatus Solibacter sp.]
MSSPIRVAPYTPEWVDAVRAFNRRIAASRQQLPETPHIDWMPGMQTFLAIEGSEVRGGYILRRQCFYARGEEETVSHYRLPLSEGVADRRYAMLGLKLLRDALAREPKLYALGMGGWDKPLPKMLKALQWAVHEVPFYFKVRRPSRFLRNILVVRTSALRRFVLDAAAITGAGWLGMRIAGHGRHVAAEPHESVGEFGQWADEIWGESRGYYTLVADRGAATLNALYPAADSRFLRIRTKGGWAVGLDTQMRDHKQFGDMRVGSIVDCFASPSGAASVMRAATGVLEDRGVDLIVSNQLHHSWCDALQQAGFRKGPSNFLLALSPALAEICSGSSHLHFNRGDGDGPIHL